LKKLELKSDPRVKAVFDAYPPTVKKQMQRLRQLVLEVAEELDEVAVLEETLKWGEPSYLAKHGSTVRMDWKQKNPEQYALYFKCTSLLVPSFKAVFNKTFTYEGNRAIVFKLDDKLPEPQLRSCIAAALRYHKVKHLPFLDL